MSIINGFIFAVCIIESTLLATHFVSLEQYMYIWDDLDYQEAVSNMLVTIQDNGFRQFLNDVKHSFKYSEYNVATQLLILPFSAIDYSNRYIFIGALSGIYLGFFTFFVYIFAKNILNIKNLYFLISIIVITLFFTPINVPTFMGLQDIAVIASLIVVYIMWFKQPIEESSYRRIILLALFLYLPFLFKKAALFLIVGFFIVTFMFSIFSFLKSNNKKVLFKKIVFKYSVLTACILLLMFFIQKGLFLGIFEPKYFNYYTDWQVGSLKEHWLRYLLYNGYFYTLLYVLAIMIGIFSKYKKIVIFLTLQIVLSFLIFIQVQGMSPQHNQQIFGFHGLLLIITMLAVIFNNSKLIVRYTVLLLSVSLFISSYVAFIYETPSTLLDNKILPTYTAARKSPNFASNLAILKNVVEIYKKNPQKIAIIDNRDLSSEVLSYYKVFYKERSLANNKVRYPVLDNAHISIFANVFKPYYYLIPAKEVCSDKSFILCLGQKSFIKKTSLAKAYKKIGEYKNDSGEVFYLYEKQRKITKDEIQAFVDEFTKIYPIHKKYLDSQVGIFYNEQ